MQYVYLQVGWDFDFTFSFSILVMNKATIIFIYSKLHVTGYACPFLAAVLMFVATQMSMA